MQPVGADEVAGLIGVQFEDGDIGQRDVTVLLALHPLVSKCCID
jgi:hypothetical protein